MEWGDLLTNSKRVGLPITLPCGKRKSLNRQKYPSALQKLMGRSLSWFKTPQSTAHYVTYFFTESFCQSKWSTEAHTRQPSPSCNETICSVTRSIWTSVTNGQKFELVQNSTIDGSLCILFLYSRVFPSIQMIDKGSYQAAQPLMQWGNLISNSKRVHLPITPPCGEKGSLNRQKYPSALQKFELVQNSTIDCSLCILFLYRAVFPSIQMIDRGSYQAAQPLMQWGNLLSNSKRVRLPITLPCGERGSLNRQKYPSALQKPMKRMTKNIRRSLTNW